MIRIIQAPTERKACAAPVRRFDDASGQIYHETTFAARSSSDTLWFKRGKAEAVAGRRATSTIGHSRLFELALRSAIVNSSSITADVLDGMPWNIARQIWETVLAS